VGSSVAYYLALAGVRVTLVDRDAQPSRATRASLGVLAHAHGRADPLSCFYRDSLALHATLADQLRQETGIDVGWRPVGGIDLAFDEQEAGSLREWIEFNLGRGAQAEWLDEAALREAEPDLSRRGVGGALFSEDARVDPVRLGQALVTGASARGALLCLNTTVTGLTPRSDGVECEFAGAGGESTETFDAAVVTAGSWSGELNPAIQVRPVRGQSVRLGGMRVGHVVRWDGRHALPDGDGVQVGATVEEVGFDLSTTEAAGEALTTWCGQVFEPTPVLREIRAGLRPKPRHGRAVIDAIDACLFVATGHYKSGVLMAPLTGQVVSRWILEGDPGRDMSPFTIKR